MKKMLISLTDTQHAHLKLFSRVDGRPMSEIIRTSIFFYLDHMGASENWRDFMEIAQEREDETVNKFVK